MAKILLDENLSRKLKNYLSGKFDEVKHVSDFDLLKSDDIEIWEFAVDSQFCILTKDNDFHAMSVISGCPPKVIRLNCGNKSTNDISQIVIKKKDLIDEFFNDSTTCYLEIG